MALFFVEITDTFAGEANYSWATHHKVRASSMRGAMSRIARSSGLHWRKVGDYGDHARYDSKSGATCAFISVWDDAENSALNVNVDLA